MTSISVKWKIESLHWEGGLKRQSLNWAGMPIAKKTNKKWCWRDKRSISWMFWITTEYLRSTVLWELITMSCNQSFPEIIALTNVSSLAVEEETSTIVKRHCTKRTHIAASVLTFLFKQCRGTFRTLQSI